MLIDSEQSEAKFDLVLDGIEIELNVRPEFAPSVLRAFAGRTPADAKVDALDIPTDTAWLKVVVKTLRWYRSSRPTSVGNRCVCDPSCSRYAELAYRELGFWRGSISTMARLWRCRPGKGGADYPTQKEKVE